MRNAWQKSIHRPWFEWILIHRCLQQGSRPLRWPFFENILDFSAFVCDSMQLNGLRFMAHIIVGSWAALLWSRPWKRITLDHLTVQLSYASIRSQFKLQQCCAAMLSSASPELLIHFSRFNYQRVTRVLHCSSTTLLDSEYFRIFNSRPFERLQTLCTNEEQCEKVDNGEFTTPAESKSGRIRLDFGLGVFGPMLNSCRIDCRASPEPLALCRDNGINWTVNLCIDGSAGHLFPSMDIWKRV